MLRRLLVFLIFAGISVNFGCGNREPIRLEYQMGERATNGPLTYNVIESRSVSQLGDLLRLRVPQQRFLLISISITNGGGQEVSVPLLSVEGANGQMYRESDNGESVSNWLGLLRSLAPAQTTQGNVLFDVPLGSYRLRLPDGAETGSEKYIWVQIPLRVDSDAPVEAPIPGKQ